MDIESVKTITNGIVEVAKIVGPALITAIFGYKIGKSQFEGKLRELEKTYAYSASEKLFEYYQNREKELDESYKSINEIMGILLGLDMTMDLDTDDDLTNKAIKIYDLYEKMLPYQIKLTLRDLKKYSLQETEDFSRRKWGQASQVHKIVIKWKKVKIGDKHGQKTKSTLPGCTLSCHCSG